MIKAAVRARPAPAANDALPKAGRPDIVQLNAFRAAAPPGIDAHARKLLSQVAAGDERAFEELYRLLSRRVYAFAMRITGNAASADEATVDTLYEVWRSAGSFR